MPIVVQCECGRTMKVDDRYAGKRGRCSKCGKGVNIPAPVTGSVTPSIVIAQEPEADEFDDEPGFAEWTPPPVAAPMEPPTVAPLSRLAAPTVTGTTSAERTDFRRQFFGLWVCQTIYRIAAWFMIAVATVATLILVFAVIAGVVAAAAQQGKESAAVGSFFGVALLAWVVPTWVATCIAACGMLATAELLTAAGWWFYRQRIGGDGPF